jgi:hypothetical protein
MFNKLYLLLFLLLSTSASAMLGLDENKKNTLTPDVTALHQEVLALPEVHFLSQQEQLAVDRLLGRVLVAQEKQIASFKASLVGYKKDKSLPSAWPAVQIGYYSALSLSLDKQTLIELSSSQVKELVTGFGPEGVTQFRSELYLTRLSVEFFIYKEIRAFNGFISDIFISPVPVLTVIFKVFILLMIVRWWLRNSARFIESISERMDKKGANRFLWHLFGYISRAHREIAWLIMITLSLRFIAQLPSLQHLVFLEIFTWWILGGSIAVSFIIEFAYQHSQKLSKAMIMLRLSTIRLYVWGFITTGLISQISEITLGKGTIYAWISSLIFFFYLLLTIYSLHKWKSYIFERLATKKEPPVWINWANKNKQRWLFATLSTAIVAVWLILRSLQHYFVAVLSQYQVFSHALAYLFRIEVAKQTETESEQTHLQQIRGEETFSYVFPGSDNSLLLTSYAQDTYDSLATYLLSIKPAVCVLSGERGVGSTTLLRRFLHDVKDAHPIYVSCPHEGFDVLMVLLCEELGLEEEGNEEVLLAHLRNTDKRYLLAFDNIQRLVKPQVGGLAPLMRLTNLLRQSRNNHGALLSIEKSSWRFVDRARGERLLFDLVEFLPRWNESEIKTLLASRITDKGLCAISFDGLVLPRQWGKDELSEDQRARNGFYRILWDYSDGNPSVALRFFRRSLFKNNETDTVEVRLFKIPSSEGLENMPKPMLAVLRSIVQLEIASPEELTDCTRLSINEVISTLRYFQSRGYIEWSGDKSRISDLCFRNITNILHRQHLLVK